MKFIVWIKEDGNWVEQGDGPLTQNQANRIASEIRAGFRIATQILPVGQAPISTSRRAERAEESA